MALIGANGMRTASGPNRMFSGVASVAGGHRNQFGTSPLNWSAGWHTIAGVSDRAAVPSGHLHPSAWVPPRKADGMSSRFEAGLSIGATGLAVGGVNIAGTSALSFGATASGQLIAFGQGTAGLTFGATGTMAGTVQASGSASFTITPNTPTLGALAGGSGTASMTFSAVADILPADDTPPARTALASFTLTGSATLRAIGYMSGSTDVTTELSESSIAAAVVDALEATTIPVDVQRVRGQALEGTGVDGDPWGPA